MTRLEALTALKEAVEAGKLPDASVWHGASAVRGHWAYVTMGADERRNVYLAYNGSLDAARALHEAVLPDFCPSIGQNIWHKYWLATLTITVGDDIGDTYSGQHTSCPARAWLIAILSALIAQEQDQ